MEHSKNNQILVGRMKHISKMLGKYYTVKIGLLAGKGGEKQVSENMDLAGLGAVQEFGKKIKVTDKMRGFFRHEFGINLKKSTTEIEIPARSWLYAPIKDANFRKMIYDYIGDQEIFDELADKEIMRELAEIIGNMGVLQIQKAFENGGINGEWKPNNPITVARKKSSMPLVGESGDLRKHITFEVE